ncbi:glycine decarboxylase subunit T NDAI_0A05880 [Naumovozyma dairenensis CBS 421]|uniref:Aminomethyltransferase n=1 Tax=Naumovozyma dairenensis (strain ATCC 10597 / BCRC 20456 / CBS 421 / NBRC 0211 / NRRL Y-12639) TaxID=1071378 RepID=G0W4K5_NAUDC|nr:hypothetical protein NDAI_0A05880 [Naumovozyma dairenensis CBS 421]CCD22743.1 hypothetical protein NDAI_0A05880 [Naumovozyma dairenensis CBS 421]
MVPFAGYSMPLLYSNQSHIESHNWTRKNAGLFDVSHMLQSKLVGVDCIKLLNKITPTDFGKVPVNYSHLSVLLNKNGGIVDDTIITKGDEQSSLFWIVTNANRIKEDSEFFVQEIHNLKEKGKENNGVDVHWQVIHGRALMALQGPKAKKILSSLLKKLDGKDDELKTFYFGERRQLELFNDILINVTRSGYTGEDGFEISVEDKHAEEVARLLLDNESTKPIGLAARDSLRLEAGMCLYGNELNETINPVEASLKWVISKSRRNNGNFNGFDKIMKQLNDKSNEKVRIGFKYLKKGPAARGGSKIFQQSILSTKDEAVTNPPVQIGEVTSGSASPTLNNINVGQGYVQNGLHKRGTPLLVQVRNKFYPIEIVKMPFVPTHYYKPLSSSE